MAALEKDVNIRFPHFILLKASAGSGKTHALTKRFVQFVLSDRIPRNHLRNTLAITFSNNAAKEMRGRILSWLKDIYFEDPDRRSELSQVLSLSPEHLLGRAEALIDDILDNYTEFQVKTIDSFMTSIYKASAIDLGYSPEFDIHMAPGPMMSYAFNRFLRKVRPGAPEAAFVERVLDLILESRPGETAYLWNPAKEILGEVEDLYRRLAGMVQEAEMPDETTNAEPIKKAVEEKARELNELVEASGLPRSKRSTFESILKAVMNQNYPDLIGKGLKSLPVLRPKEGEENASFREISRQWDDLGREISRYTEAYAFRYYVPYLEVYAAFKSILEKVKKEEGVVFIDDVNKKLSDYLRHEMVPDIYLRLGETIYHYLIDEFQDTSPIQWNNLVRLIENALSQGGSLFVVGDTKQAIYGFRNADFRIMRKLESENPFSSAYHEVRELGVNYRSLEKVIQFSKDVFQSTAARDEKYEEATRRSGLADYRQEVRGGNEALGHVEVTLYERNEDEPHEKRRLQTLIRELRERGYAHSDIGILAFKNEEAVHVTVWLNEMNVPFISYSSLDVRRRKLFEEILFLLTFLDSPPDDFSFSGFLLGEIFRAALKRTKSPIQVGAFHDFLLRHRRQAPLYKCFQQEFPELWETYLDKLFRFTGYLPLYDLVCEIYRFFEVFQNFQEEEATLIKILEVIKTLEKKGINNLGDFLSRASGEEESESDWNIKVPAGVDAVQVMTIHKAKGLDFPVAIVLLYEEQARGFKYLFGEGDEKVSLLKINRNIAEASSLLRRLYEEERIKETVNKLNTLYVGFTRAKRELYVIGVHGKRRQFPTDLIEKMEGHAKMEQLPIENPRQPGHPVLRLCHYPVRRQLPHEGGAERLSLEERSRGDFIHRVLSFIDFCDTEIELKLDKVIQRVKEEFVSDYGVELLKKILGDFLALDSVRPYFSPRPGLVILKEQDFSDSSGRLFRMDRVVIDGDAVTVMDYKTGSEKGEEERHVSQLRNYLGILKDLYPEREVKGILAYVDLGLTREIV